MHLIVNHGKFNVTGDIVKQIMDWEKTLLTQNIG